MNLHVHDPQTRQTIVRLLSSMASAKEISQYLKRFSQLDAKRFAVVKVGGAVLRDDLAAKQATAAQYRAAVATIPDLKVKVAQLEQDRAEFVRALPTTQQFGQIVDQLRANASASKSEITNLSFANGQATNLPAGVRPININLNVKGQYGQIFQLMRRLETQNRFTTVNTLDLQLPKADSFNPDVSMMSSLLRGAMPTIAPLIPSSGVLRHFGSATFGAAVLFLRVANPSPSLAIGGRHERIAAH